MTRFLGAQLARMDIDRMEVPEEELAKLDLTKISFFELRQMARRAPNEFDKESEKIRRKFFMVFSEIFWAQKEEIKSGMCPASIAGESGNRGAIIKEFTDWVCELLCEHYVPIVCAENQCPPSVG